MWGRACAWAAPACAALALLGCGGEGSSQDGASAPPRPNTPPVASARQDVIVPAGERFAIDATLGGQRIEDPDGDALTYVIRLRGSEHVAVNGTQLSGVLDGEAVEVTLVGTDPHGARAEAVFMLAGAAPPPGAPTLPATPYLYKDESLPLPDDYRLSSQVRVPLWDAQPQGNRTTDAGAALGRVLFYDRRLSSTNTVACASCHQREHGFASAQRFNTGVLGLPLTRNAMALGNARYNIHAAWFSDARVSSIQEVARQAITTPEEMGNTLPAVVAKLQDTSFYAALFEAAFGTSEITAERVLRALEQYVQALIAYRTRYDRACDSVGGAIPDCDAALSGQEARGRFLFEHGADGRVACVQCHALPAGANIWLANNGLDATVTDAGVGNGRFRPASLYNIARTAPYMHDGRFVTLREVIEHYDHGIQASPDLDPLLRDGAGSAQRMNLSEEDKDALEAFLRTLTDEQMLADPKFADPFS